MSWGGRGRGLHPAGLWSPSPPAKQGSSPVSQTAPVYPAWHTQTAEPPSSWHRPPCWHSVSSQGDRAVGRRQQPDSRDPELPLQPPRAAPALGRRPASGWSCDAGVRSRAAAPGLAPTSTLDRRVCSREGLDTGTQPSQNEWARTLLALGYGRGDGPLPGSHIIGWLAAPPQPTHFRTPVALGTQEGEDRVLRPLFPL